MNDEGPEFSQGPNIWGLKILHYFSNPLNSIERLITQMSKTVYNNYSDSWVTNTELANRLTTNSIICFLPFMF